MESFLIHLFFPHHTNNHRAKALHIEAFLVYAIGLLFFQSLTLVGARSYPDVLGYATDIRVGELLSLTNAKRQEAGLGSLSPNDKLSQAAAGKAADMFAKNYWAHTSPDGKLPWDFIVGAGYKYTVAGENLAKNFNDSKGVVDAWMASSSHRENLLKGAYHDIGFAVVNGKLDGEETTLVVQMFGTSSNPIAAAAQPNVVKGVSAQEPGSSALVPKAVVTAYQAPAPVVVSEHAEVTLIPASEVPFALQSFQEVVQRPLINLFRMNKMVSVLILGFLIMVFAIDAWVVARRRLVRVAGHSHAHILFLGALLLVVLKVLPGSVL